MFSSIMFPLYTIIFKMSTRIHNNFNVSLLMSQSYEMRSVLASVSAAYLFSFIWHYARVLFILTGSNNTEQQ
jgi:hypothetical protein